MDNLQANKKIIENCSKLGICETSSLFLSCKNKEEVGMYKAICESLLQQRQRKAIEEHRF